MLTNQIHSQQYHEFLVASPTTQTKLYRRIVDSEIHPLYLSTGHRGNNNRHRLPGGGILAHTHFAGNSHNASSKRPNRLAHRSLNR
ncbi:hypothetical protein DPMN_090413 [Dreissena polymorpha]|uniref:Uncharacterized protein n=1 Tax=Dreissena polymorpha TaxID=45954 RepID=A0A9D4KZP0_DREPO|nr:hypothetical protein DPMN_090413 [Dreissena polymorpha]